MKNLKINIWSTFRQYMRIKINTLTRTMKFSPFWHIIRSMRYMVLIQSALCSHDPKECIRYLQLVENIPKYFLEDYEVITYLEKSLNVRNFYIGGLVVREQDFGVQNKCFLKCVLMYMSDFYEFISDKEIYIWRAIKHTHTLHENVSRCI